MFNFKLNFFVLFLASVVSVKAISANEIELTAEQMKTLQIIHQLSWSAQKVYTFNDYVALFEEQSALSSDGLDLSYFKEDTGKRDLYDIVKELRDTIFEIKLSEEEKRKMEEFQEDERTISLLQNISIFKGLNPSYQKIQGDPYGELAVMGAKLVANIGEGISNYFLIRKKLELQLKKNLWEEEKKNYRLLHESMQNFDEKIKNAIVLILPADKKLRTTLAHVKELVEAVKKADLNGTTPEDNNKEKIISLLNFLQMNERYYLHFPMYWYYRGVCEQNVKNYKDAIAAYKRYQSLDIGLIKYNKVSASVAMNLINILLTQKNSKREIYSQLKIIYDNIDIQAIYWNLPYYAGLVYLYQFNDVENALKMLGTAEEKLNRKYKEDWSKFTDKLMVNKGLILPTAKPNVPASSESVDNNLCENIPEGSVPSGRNLYLCRLALNHARMLEAKKSIEHNSHLMDDLIKISDEETTSIFEELNYFGSTGSKLIFAKCLRELSSVRLIVNYECGIDELISVMPLKFFLLREIFPTLRFYSYNKYTQKYEKSKVKCLYRDRMVTETDVNGVVRKMKQPVLEEEVYDNYEERFITLGKKVKLTYDVEIDHLTDAGTEYVELFVPHGENSFSVLFDLSDLFNNDINDPFMFARAVIYRDKLYRLPSTIVADGFDDTFEDCMGGNSFWDSIQRCNGWRIQTLKWPGGNTRIVDNFNRVRLSFPKDSEGAISLKEKIWKDICVQLKEGNFWENWLQENPPVVLTEENRDANVHSIFVKQVKK